MTSQTQAQQNAAQTATIDPQRREYLVGIATNRVPIDDLVRRLDAMSQAQRALLYYLDASVYYVTSRGTEVDFYREIEMLRQVFVHSELRTKLIESIAQRALDNDTDPKVLGNTHDNPATEEEFAQFDAVAHIVMLRRGVRLESNRHAEVLYDLARDAYQRLLELRELAALRKFKAETEAASRAAPEAPRPRNRSTRSTRTTN